MRLCVCVCVSTCVLNDDCTFAVICDIFIVILHAFIEVVEVLFTLWCLFSFFMYFPLCARLHSNVPNGMNTVVCILYTVFCIRLHHHDHHHHDHHLSVPQRCASTTTPSSSRARCGRRAAAKSAAVRTLTMDSTSAPTGHWTHATT